MNIDSGEFLAKLQEFNSMLNNIDAMSQQKAPYVQPKRIAQFMSEDNNLLVEDVRSRFVQSIRTTGIAPSGRQILSPMYDTTSALSGELINAENIDEKNIAIFDGKTNSKVVIIHSNFGKIIDPSYPFMVEAAKLNALKKSTRGRKKTDKKQKKPRKKQGTGECFNSQITMTVLSNVASETSESGFKEFHFKVFHQNKIQLPGASSKMINEVITACGHLVEVINAGLNPQNLPEKQVKIVKLNPTMKNYKFFLRMEPKQILNMQALFMLLMTEKLRSNILKLDEFHSVYVDHNNKTETKELLNSEDSGQVLQQTQTLQLAQQPQQQTMQQSTNNADRIKSHVYNPSMCGDPISVAAYSIWLGGNNLYGNKCSDCFYKQVYDMISMKESKMPNITANSESSNNHPVVYDVVYTREKNNLAVIFSTPSANNASKRVRVDIFSSKEISKKYHSSIVEGVWGAKINMIGAHDDKITESIYKYLLELFDRYYEYIVGNIGASTDEYEWIVVDSADNTIDNIIDEECVEYGADQVKKELYAKYKGLIY